MTTAHLVMQWIAYIMAILFSGFWLVAKITASTFAKLILKLGAILVIVYIILEIFKVHY